MGAVAGGGIVQLPGEARTIDVGGFTVVVHAGAGVTSGAFSLVETVEAMAGSGPPLHVHRDAAESFYVIEGEYVMSLDDLAEGLRAGVDETGLDEIAGRYAMDVLGPAPEGYL
jgi:hypothetical protein